MRQSTIFLVVFGFVLFANAILVTIFKPIITDDFIFASNFSTFMFSVAAFVDCTVKYLLLWLREKQFYSKVNSFNVYLSNLKMQSAISQKSIRTRFSKIQIKTQSIKNKKDKIIRKIEKMRKLSRCSIPFYFLGLLFLTIPLFVPIEHYICFSEEPVEQLICISNSWLMAMTILTISFICFNTAFEFDMEDINNNFIEKSEKDLNVTLENSEEIKALITET